MDALARWVCTKASPASSYSVVWLMKPAMPNGMPLSRRPSVDLLAIIFIECPAGEPQKLPPASWNWLCRAISNYLSETTEYMVGRTSASARQDAWLLCHEGPTISALSTEYATTPLHCYSMLDTTTATLLCMASARAAVGSHPLPYWIIAAAYESY